VKFLLNDFLFLLRYNNPEIMETAIIESMIGIVIDGLVSVLDVGLREEVSFAVDKGDGGEVAGEVVVGF
jgi:hypothetical protein